MTHCPTCCQLHPCPTCCPQSTCHAIPKWLEPFVQQLEAESERTPTPEAIRQALDVLGIDPEDGER